MAEFQAGDLRVSFRQAIPEITALAANHPQATLLQDLTALERAPVDFESIHEAALQEDDLNAKEQAIEELMLLDPELYENLRLRGDLVKRDDNTE